MMKQKNNISELVFILDRSGSMSGLEGDTIGGFNATIERQRAVEGPCWVTTVLFDGQVERLHDRIALEKVPKMTEKDYTVRGCTALLDAIGETVRHIEDIHRYARPEDVPAHTTFVIMTDGMENASRRFGSSEVKKLIEQKKAAGWEFLFLAANIDAVETAAGLGIGADRAVDYHADGMGTKLAYKAVAKAVGCARMGRAIANDWCEEVREDYAARK